MLYFAHTGKALDKSDWQLLADHLRAVAELAAQMAAPLGLEKAAFLAGLFHDLGKYAPAFQRRLEGAEIRVDIRRRGHACCSENSYRGGTRASPT
nr:CRISPR-associated endonuclease Cas3'' [Rhizobium sp. Q54]